MATTRKSVAADASLKRGKSALKSFRYYKGFAFVTLTNGVSGIVGSATDFPFPTMLALKGSGMQLEYQQLKQREEGDTFERYSLEWCVD
jgi:hypothetical protein